MISSLIVRRTSLLCHDSFHPPTPTHDLSPSPHGRPRRLVLATTIQIEDDAGVVSGVDAGKRNQRARRTVAAVGDRDLATRDIYLRLAGVVQRDMLDTHQVVTRWRALGHREGKVDLVCADGHFR